MKIKNIKLLCLTLSIIASFITTSTYTFKTNAMEDPNSKNINKEENIIFDEEKIDYDIVKKATEIIETDYATTLMSKGQIYEELEKRGYTTKTIEEAMDKFRIKLREKEYKKTSCPPEIEIWWLRKAYDYAENYLIKNGPKDKLFNKENLEAIAAELIKAKFTEEDILYVWGNLDRMGYNLCEDSKTYLNAYYDTLYDKEVLDVFFRLTNEDEQIKNILYTRLRYKFGMIAAEYLMTKFEEDNNHPHDWGEQNYKLAKTRLIEYGPMSRNQLKRELIGGGEYKSLDISSPLYGKRFVEPSAKKKFYPRSYDYSYINYGLTDAEVENVIKKLEQRDHINWKEQAKKKLLNYIKERSEPRTVSIPIYEDKAKEKMDPNTDSYDIRFDSLIGYKDVEAPLFKDEDTITRMSKMVGALESAEFTQSEISYAIGFDVNKLKKYTETTDIKEKNELLIELETIGEKLLPALAYEIIDKSLPRAKYKWKEDYNKEFGTGPYFSDEDLKIDISLLVNEAARDSSWTLHYYRCFNSSEISRAKEEMRQKLFKKYENQVTHRPRKYKKKKF